MKTWRPVLLVPALLMALGACSVTPPFEPPKVAVPAQWDVPTDSSPGAASDDQVVADAEWWTSFGSDELNQLMLEALASNHDVAAAAARIEQARATARTARSRLVPTVTASLTGSKDRLRSNDSTDTSSNDEASLLVNYELDLWGGNSASATAADARVRVSQYDRQALRLVLEADVASTYFQALALKDRIAIAQTNLESAQKLLGLVQNRFDNGAANGLEVAQQRTTLLGIEAGVPLLTQSLSETQSALAVLLGRAPQGFTIRGGGMSDLKLPTVKSEQPAQLLERRPDLKSAEASLYAANADVGAARAALYPSLNLSAAAAASGWLTGGTSTLTSLTGSLMQTLFAGGSLRAEVAYNEATRQELVETYAQTLLTSFKEVQDSLSSISSSQLRSGLLEQTADQAGEAYRLAGVRYQAGSDDLLSLLTTQQSLLTAQDNLAQARLTTYSATAGLFKALGGGWSM